MSYNKDIEFLIVYIREAHPNLLKEGNETGVVDQPKTLDERIILATECATKYKLTIPMVIDGMDGKVNKDYQAVPVRVTVVDIDGKVVFYAGKGPRDFRLPPVERTLRKLIAHGGHMPPAPKPQWGQPVNGLRCGLSIDPAKVTLGEPVALQVRFENTTRKPINLYNPPKEGVRNVVIKNSDGQALQIKIPSPDRWSRMFEQAKPIHRIAPGQTYESITEGRIVASSGETESATGPFRAVYNIEVNDETQVRTESIWTGKLRSGTFVLNVVQPPN